MAPNRKGKGMQSQSTSTSRKSNASWNSATDATATILSKQQKEQQKVDMQLNEFQEILDEVQGKMSFTKPFSSWKEIAVAGLALLTLGSLSVIVGIVAGMTISIHYFDDPLFHVDRNGMVISSQHKVTTYDNEIVARNVLSGSSNLDLGRVEKTTIKGERSVFSLVREAEQMGPELEARDTGAFRDIFFSPLSIQPTLCPDGYTIGFSNWEMLKTAVREANSLSAERFLRWNEYFSSIESNEFGAFQDDVLYYEDESIFTICPGVTLKARKGPIFINSENVVIECEGCTIDVGGTHFSFGPHARNVFVRGITFKGAQTSSLTFHHNGVDATFEDCLWICSSSKSKLGPVADVNSTR
jgi:hypothetical protein